MPKTYSIAEARSSLPGLIHELEGGGSVEITRRGKAVAVMLSVSEFNRLAPATPTFAQAFSSWRASVELDEVAVDTKHFDRARDRSPGRRVKL